MIVKNESKIITRLLKSVERLIDSYCICDTGSTDNTIEIIENFFVKQNIKGVIIREPFRDFAYNRTFALQKCSELPNVDYILLLDADMVLEIDETMDIQEFKNTLSSDAYYLYQGSPSFFYKNIRLIKNQKGLSYWGVTHEYLNLPKNSTSITIEKNQIFIKDIGDGGAKQDKFLRDIRLLEQGLIENPNEPRYLFYLANSYRDSDQYEKAIEIYHKRILQGGWYEEVWHSYYSIGNCYESLNDTPNAIYYWLEAFHKDEQRIENLYKIIKYYREQKHYKLAYHFYNIAKEGIKTKTNWDHLFLQKSVYDYYLDYEFSIIGYYCNIDHKTMRTTSMNILMFYNTDASTFQSVLDNYKYYCENMVLDIEYMPLKKSFMEFYTPLNIYNGTPAGRLNRDLRATLPINELKGNPPIEGCPILNLHRCKESENHSVYLKSILNADENKGILHNKMKCYPIPIQDNELIWYIGKIVSSQKLKYCMFIGLDTDKKIKTYSQLYPRHLLLQ